MTPLSTPARRLLRTQAVGFLVIVALCWFVELVRLPYLLFGEAPVFNWPRVLFRTVVVLAVWAWAYLSTRRLFTRLHQLEEFLLLCSWCRKIGHQGTWLTTEEYFGSTFDTETSHGICPECARLHFKEHLARRKEREKCSAGARSSGADQTLPLP